MRRTAVWSFPGRSHQRSGGYEYDRRIVAGLRARGWAVDVQRARRAAFRGHPRRRSTTAAPCWRRFRTVPRSSSTVSRSARCRRRSNAKRSRLHLVALVHLPLAADIGIDRQEATGSRRANGGRWRPPAVCIVTGTATARARSRRTASVANRSRSSSQAPIARRWPRAPGNPLHLVSVAAITPGKGHEILLRALGRLRHRAWRLTCAGSVDRHPADGRSGASTGATPTARETGRAGRRTRRRRRSQRSTTPPISSCTPRCTKPTGWSSPKRCARGVPVVGSATGAIPDLVGADAGLLVPPGDAAALSRRVVVGYRRPGSPRPSGGRSASCSRSSADVGRRR